MNRKFLNFVLGVDSVAAVEDQALLRSYLSQTAANGIQSISVALLLQKKPQRQRGSILGNVFCIKTGLQFHNSQNRIDSKNGACKTVCISQTCFSLIALSARRNQKYSWIESAFFSAVDAIGYGFVTLNQ